MWNENEWRVRQGGGVLARKIWCFNIGKDEGVWDGYNCGVKNGVDVVEGCWSERGCWWGTGWKVYRPESGGGRCVGRRVEVEGGSAGEWRWKVCWPESGRCFYSWNVWMFVGL